MLSTWKYTLFLALALPAVYAYAPLNLGEITKPRWLDSIGVFITRSLASVTPKPSVSPVDSVAAANVDEDLDYRIAQRMKSSDGWRAFLTAHPDGPHAQLARAELDKLATSETPPAPAAAEALDARASDAKTSADVGSPVESEVAAPASDEICRQDEDRLEQLSNSLTGDGVIRFMIELRCEKLRPQLLRLAERLDDKAPPAVAYAAPSALSSVLPESVLSSPPLPPPRMRTNEPQKRAPSILSSRGAEPKRRAAGWTPPDLGQLISALFGQAPRNSTAVRRTPAGAGPGGGGH
jgi:hypothetical protein